MCSLGSSRCVCHSHFFTSQFPSPRAYAVSAFALALYSSRSFVVVVPITWSLRPGPSSSPIVCPHSRVVVIVASVVVALLVVAARAVIEYVRRSRSPGRCGQGLNRIVVKLLCFAFWVLFVGCQPGERHHFRFSGHLPHGHLHSPCVRRSRSLAVFESSNCSRHIVNCSRHTLLSRSLGVFGLRATIRVARVLPACLHLILPIAQRLGPSQLG